MDNRSIIASCEKSYSEEWQATSEEYDKLGVYDVSLAQIEGCSSVLEIGAGSGIPLSKMMSTGFRVTSIEENNSNFLKICETVQKSGLPLKAIRKLESEKPRLAEDNLVLANFITDPRLHDLVISHVGFDSIICWFVGAQMAMHLKEEMKSIGYTERQPATYRSLIYEKLFSETSEHLECGGLISLIERAPETEQANLNQYALDLATDHDFAAQGLEVQSIEQIPIGKFSEMNGIKMEAFKGDELQKMEPDSFGLVAIKIIKKC